MSRGRKAGINGAVERVQSSGSLTDEQQAIFDDTVGSMPADYFSPTHVPMLERYAVIIAMMRRMKVAADEGDMGAWKDYLTAGAKAGALERAMRLTHQSHMSPKSAGAAKGKSTKSPAPWEFNGD